MVFGVILKTEFIYLARVEMVKAFKEASHASSGCRSVDHVPIVSSRPPILDRPAALGRQPPQPAVRVDRDGASDGLQHRQVAVTIGVGERLPQVDAVLL